MLFSQTGPRAEVWGGFKDGEVSLLFSRLYQLRKIKVMGGGVLLSGGDDVESDQFKWFLLYLC